MNMVFESLKIIEPAFIYKNEFYAYCEAFRKLQEPPRPLEELAYQDFSAFIKKLREASEGIGIPPGYVPSTTYWLVGDERKILGNSTLRHRLTPTLEIFGGHIGYAIHPLERRKGYGSLILKLTLEKAQEKGIKKVMVTCDTENIASARVIIHNGGILENQELSQQSGKLISRFWISL
jgi:predicted acetyltransferase